MKVTIVSQKWRSGQYWPDRNLYRVEKSLNLSLAHMRHMAALQQQSFVTMSVVRAQSQLNNMVQSIAIALFSRGGIDWRTLRDQLRALPRAVLDLVYATVDLLKNHWGWD